MVEFVPEANETHAVRGEFAEGGSAVWVEALERKVLMGQKIEVKGSTALGVLAK